MSRVPLKERNDFNRVIEKERNFGMLAGFFVGFICFPIAQWIIL